MTAARPVAPAPSTTAFSSSISLHRVTTAAVVSPSAGSSPQDGDGDPGLADRHNLVNQGPARGQGVHPHRGHGQAWTLSILHVCMGVYCVCMGVYCVTVCEAGLGGHLHCSAHLQRSLEAGARLKWRVYNL